MAPAPTQFEVVPTDTAWEITQDGADFLAVQTRQVAVDEAVFQATQNRPSRVVVKRLDGSVEEEASFDGESTPAQPTPAPAEVAPAADAEAAAPAEAAAAAEKQQQPKLRSLQPASSQ